MPKVVLLTHREGRLINEHPPPLVRPLISSDLSIEMGRSWSVHKSETGFGLFSAIYLNFLAVRKRCINYLVLKQNNPKGSLSRVAS